MAIVLNKWKISYVPVPKAACSSLKLMFFHLENGRDFQPAMRNGQMFHIHRFYATTAFASLPHAAIQDHWRIAVVRDPVKRFLSCYSNRVCHYKELSQRHLPPDAIRSGATPNPSLEEFVEKLELYRQYSKPIKHHTDPQIFFLGEDENYFHRIFQMHELQELVHEVSARTKTPLELPHAQSHGPKLSTSELSANAVTKIKKFYQQDYDCFPLGNENELAQVSA